eukprot:CAMPEP_0170848732 /NCGR_PEP_ID=MMETSP0734-20130129/9562_1 /TAXON_ID=186038 /ORGANISM="Fragilariopsis kerguelensis, Strain L26-C5" /LENGTH=82 /DNA_ID=CAMNT_0011218215 /DNA_START=556 /DNA_END=804 /DNA_ORIENTATION=+
MVAAAAAADGHTTTSIATLERSYRIRPSAIINTDTDTGTGTHTDIDTDNNNDNDSDSDSDTVPSSCDPDEALKVFFASQLIQ